MPVELLKEFKVCYQCRKCSAGCPVGDVTDLPVDQVMGWLKMGDLERVLHSEHIWICIGCHACSARCPNQVDPAEILDRLRAMALAEGIRPPARVETFHDAFLAVMKRHGRISESEFMTRYYLKHFPSLSDIKKGIQLLVKGRMKLLPHRSSNRKELQRILDAADEEIRRKS